MKVSQFVELIDRLAPFRLAEEWDRVGLQVGDPDAAISGLMVCLEVTADVVTEARRHGANLILSHHPLIFKPLESLRRDRPNEGLALELARQEIALVAAHTNLDRSPMGVNAALAELIGLGKRRMLIPGPGEKRYKYVVFVPEGHEAEIIEAMHMGGGGVIGDYDHCTTRVAATGTFRGREGLTDPAIGQAGRLEEARELRIETVVPRRQLRRLIREVESVHPYEEVAFDVYPLEAFTEEWGLGLIGMLAKEMKLGPFISHIKEVLGVEAVQFIGAGDDFAVKTVAVLGGAANSKIGQILDRNFDVIIVGELNHHAAHEVLAAGTNAICVGHFASERPVVSYFSRILERQNIIAESEFPVLVAQSERDPIRAK